MDMNNKLKQVFSQIQAEDELKNNTGVFVAKKTQGYTRVKTEKLQYWVYAASCVCLLLILFGGVWFYLTPTAEISIDVNPSIELGINQFGQVISVNNFNEDGQELSKSLNIKFQNYTDAIKQILNNDKIVTLLSDNEIMTITVTGTDGLQSAKILSEVKTCTAKQRNTYCYSTPSEEVAAAHETGLSYGKYRAFLEVQILDPNITPEIVQNMTMREIRELIDRLSDDNDNTTSSYSQQGNGHHGYGNNYKRGQGNGRENQDGCE